MSKLGIKCIEPGCLIGSFKESRCFNHYKIHVQSKSSKREPWSESNRKQSLPNNWAALRMSILQRDNFICYICGRPGADSVDHIKPGQDHSPSNLAAAHQNIPPFCHRTKSAQEGAAASRKAREEAKKLEPFVEKFSPMLVASIINRDGDTCGLCGGSGADYAYRLSKQLPPIASNVAPVHYFVSPNCVLSL